MNDPAHFMAPWTYNPQVGTAGALQNKLDCMSPVEAVTKPRLQSCSAPPPPAPPKDCHGSKKPASQEQAMAELVEAVTNTKLTVP